MTPISNFILNTFRSKVSEHPETENPDLPKQPFRTACPQAINSAHTLLSYMGKHYLLSLYMAFHFLS